jgi:beta-glucanase (GH16 family)
MKSIAAFCVLLGLCSLAQAQTTFFQDDFEGGPSIATWFGDACGLNTAALNPSPSANNPSSTCLGYFDVGGQYANVRFDLAQPLDLSAGAVVSIKIFVPSATLIGSQPNQVSLKLQDGNLSAPWTTQSEIIKPIVLDEWQTVTFDFANDAYINLDPGSPAPTTRTDFNRVLIQVNGENNFDGVTAYIDDVFFDASFVPPVPVFDNLVWNDEFDVDGAVDPTKWFAQTQLPAGGSWFNGEIQHYTDRIQNAFVDNGTLKVMARKETFTDQGFTKTHTSARLNSKFAFTYGRVEVRAKLPTGVGTWPAIWMLGQNINEAGAYWQTQGFGTTGWPFCGEIDIMEHWGDNPNYVSSATHTPSSFGATVNVGGTIIPTATTDFHVYGLTWTSEKLVFDVDGVVHYTYEPSVLNDSTWPFNAPEYLIFNVAVLPFIDPAITEAAMEIDYVRVYQESPCPAPTGATTTVLSPTAATLSWNPVSEAIGYQVVGGPVGGPTRSFKTTATARTLPILDPSTAYQWQVQAYCDPELSDFSPLQDFSTPATRVATQTLKLHPNPATDRVQVYAPIAGEGSLQLMDATGAVLRSEAWSGEQRVLDVSELPAGLYLLRLETGTGIWQDRLVLQ